MKHIYTPQTNIKNHTNNFPVFCHLLLLFVFFFSSLHFNTVIAQQIIGIFPEVNGSFSNQPATLLHSNPFTPPQTDWTTEIVGKGIVKDSGGRSDPHYLQFMQNGATSRKLYTPTMGTKIKKNTAYTIQFYAKGDMDGTLTNNPELKISISPNGTNNLISTAWLNDNDTAFVDWTLFSFTLTTANVAETNGLVILEANNTRLIYIDDFVIYPGSFDVTPPNDPDTLIVGTTTFTSVNLSWTAPQGGLDSGGYILVRYNVKPEDEDVVNFKGIYNVGDTIFGTNKGKVVYIGTGTSFLDNSGLSSNSEYWYKLYAVDKAFNYSPGKVATAFTLNVYPEINVVQNIHDFGLVTVGSMSLEQSYTVSGINLVDTIFVTCPLPFKISKTSGSGFTSTLKLIPVAGVVPVTNIYVRFEPQMTGLISAGILNKTFGTSSVTINVTGSGYKSAPTVQASNINCTDIGPRSMNVNWTDGNGDRRLVKINTTNSFTDPIDNTYPVSNPKYSGTGEQVLYKGSDAIFNAYGFFPLNNYWFRVYEYNNTDTLTKYKVTTYTLNPNTCATTDKSDFFEDFELGALDSYYADTLVTLESGKWHFVKAAIGTQSNDKKRGGKAARILKGGYIAMNFDSPKGLDTITIYHANYRSDQNGMFMVQYSNDQGVHFHSLGTVTCNANGSLQKTSLPALIQGPVRLVINVINGDRVDIDDIAFNDYILTTWSGFSNTDWSNINNWDNGVPDSTKDVIIPTTPLGNPNNFPVVSASNGICSDIKILSGASLTINPNGALTVLGKLTALDSLIILSDATGTGSLITYGNFSGTAHVYKYILGGNKTNLVSTPLSNALSGVFSAATPADTLKYFTESSAAWTKIINNTTALTPVMRGYSFKRSGTGTVVFSGNLNNYSENITLSRTTSSAYKGFNLIGNPYPSGINWNSDSLNTSSLAHKTYWTNANESFATYNGNAKIGCPATVNNIIPPMEGFFVKLNAPLTTLNFKLNNYTRKHPTDAPDSSSLSPNIFRLKVNQQSQSSSDEIALAFFTSATDTFDIFDSEKLFSFNNTVPQIYTQFQSNKITINSSTPITHFKSFPMGFKAPVAGNYILTPKLGEYDVSQPVFLKDKLVHDSLTDLRTVAQYNFSSLVVSGDTNRFDVLFYPCYFTRYTFTYDSTYCEGGSGVDIKLNSSEYNVNYQLYKNGVVIGTVMPGNGSPITWHNMYYGNYTVKAISTIIPSCSTYFTDTATVTQILLPTSYTFEPVAGTSYCQGANGVSVHVVNSQNNFHYQLLKNGSAYGSIKTGNGSAIVWNNLLAGTYSLMASTSTTPVCSRIFSNTIIITMTPAPATFNVTCNPNYCQSNGGVIHLQSSEINTNYQIKKNGLPVSGFNAYSGTGGALEWDGIPNAGLYYIIATSTITGCSISMNDTVQINFIMSPTAYSLNGGGNFCAGQGVVGLQSSQATVSYQLIKDTYTNIGSPVTGTGGSLQWTNLSAGFYTVTASTNTTPQCNSDMSGVIQVQEVAPIIYTLTGSGSYCTGASGLSATLSGSQTGANYQLKKGGVSLGSAVAGAGSALVWTNLTSGTYTVVATLTTTPFCSSTMGGSVVITASPLPTVFNLTGGGNYCIGDAGLSVTLSGSQTGINYQLKKGGVNSGTAVSGTGSALVWSSLTFGTYTVVATYVASPFCTSNMSGSVVIAENPVPFAYNLTGGGTYCAGASGLTVNLSGSQTGINYQLKKNGTDIGSAVSGTGSALAWTNQLYGTYTIVATYVASPFCSASMNGSVVITENPLPTIFTLTGGGNYCIGGSGLSVILNGSQTGINYQLKKGGVNSGSAISGTGSSLTWNNLTFGTYTVVATYVASPFCTANMSGSVVITENPIPTTFNLIGGGTYCASASGLSVTLSGSQTGINYQLKKNGTDQGGTVSGTGSSLLWNNLTYGTYTVMATYVASPNCTATMSGSVVITESPVPVLFNLTGGGSYCTGSSGLSISLSGSQTGINYQLKKNNVDFGSAVSGTGTILTWNNLLFGTYTVTATYVASPYCTATMSGSVVITESSVPTMFNLTGGGNYCAGSTGLSVTLSSSQTGINYQLKKNSVDQGSAISGTGSSLIWNDLLFGTYTIVASYVASPNCSATMIGSVVITERPAPNVFNITGGGNYCTGASGLSVTLSGSQNGINYQLKKNNINEGTAVSGTGAALIWNNLTSGTYTVAATYVASPNCSATMNGSVVITENPSPAIYNLTGGGSYCAGGSGLSITLSGSETGVNYQLKNNNVNQGSTTSGSGSTLTWSSLSSGTYTVVATYVASPNCSSSMNGSIVITENSIPTVYNFTGGGNYCSSGSGLNDTLSGSQVGVSYQLVKNSVNEGTALSGTGAALVWNNLTSGTYTVVAFYISTPGCTATMNGSVVITSTLSPTLFNLTGGGSSCSGGAGLSDTLSGSQTGVSYQLKKNGVNEGIAVPGTGLALVWNSLSGGTYTVVATFTTPPYCSAIMNNTLVLSESPSPSFFNLSGGGKYCAGATGQSATLSGSQSGYNYQLKKGGINSGTTVSGTGSALVWTNLTFGSYTVVSTYNAAPYCSTIMNGTVTVTESPTPTLFNVTGGGSYCTGASGFFVSISGSQTGVYYQLKKNGVNQGSSIAGTGSSFFWNTGLTFGTYTVVATYLASPNCSATMNGSAVYTEIIPIVYILTGGGNYCSGTTGLSDTLSGSQVGYNYQLKKNGVNEGSAVSGTGSALIWNNLTAGTYTVVATYAITPFCTANMSGTVIINESPVPAVFNLTSPGSYCTGSSGSSVTLSGSEFGVNYQLIKNSINEGSPVSGTGSSLVWNNLTSDTYTVVATYGTTPYCSANMNGSVVITESPLPITFSLTGGGTYCSGQPGLSVTLNGSQTGIDYQLLSNGTPQGSLVSGTGTSLVWNNLTAGTYTVSATYVAPPYCAAPMNGSVVITENTSPAITQITDIADCPGSTIYIGNFVSIPSGATFAWTNSNTAIGLVASGTGNIASWNAPANNTGADILSTITATPTLNGCIGTPMTFSITVYPTPTVTQITNIAVCPGSAINIGSFISVPSGATITWTNSNTAIGLAASGTGNITSWSAPVNNTGVNIVGTITVTPSLNGCGGTPMTFTITVYPTPAITQTTNIAVCPGSAINVGNFISVPSGATFAWTNSNTAIGLATSGTGNISSWTAPANNTGVNITGTIAVTPSLNGCAGTPMTFTVTVYPTPTVTQITTIAVCPGSTINVGNFVSVPSGATFAWTNSNTAIGLAASGTGSIASWNAPTNNTGANIVGSITVTPFLNGCPGTPMIFTITIYPTPAVSTITDIAVCPGSTINIGNFVSSPTGATLAWTNSNTAIGLVASGTGNITSWNAPTNNTGANIVGIITVTPTLNGCAGTPMTFNVTLYPTPTINQITNIAVCTGSAINIGNFISVPSGASFTWTNSNTAIGLVASGSGNIASWTAPANNTGVNIIGTITVMPSLNGCTGTPMTFTVTVYPTTTITQITNIAVCPGSGISIGNFVSVPPGATFAWTNSNTAIGLVASGTGNIASWTAPANNTGTNITGTIIVTPTLNGCAGTTMTFSVTIYPTPTVSQISNITACPGSTINIGSFISVPSGATIAWTNSNTTIGLVANGTGNISSWTAPANNTGVNITGTITVTPSLNGCTGTPMTFTITVYPTPTVIQKTNISVCPGLPINIGSFVSMPSGGSFAWVNSNTAIGLAASGSGNISSWTAPANNTGANIVGTITVTPSLNGCSGTPMTFTVTVYPTTTVTQITNIAVCPGATINIGSFVTMPSGATFAWANSNTAIGLVASGTDNIASWNAPANNTGVNIVGTITVTPSLNGCTGTPMTFTVTIYPTTTVTQITNIAVCPGSTINIGSFVSVPSGANFAWTNSNTAIGLVASGTGNITSWTAPANNTGVNIVGTITVTPSLNSCTGTPMIFTVTVYPITTVTQKTDIAVCPGSTINIGSFVSVPSGAIFAWTNSNTAIGLVASGTGNIASWTAPANNTGVNIVGTITVTPSLNGCTGTPMTFTITVYPTTTVTQITNIAVCPGSTINIGNFVSVPSGATFAWTNSNIAIGLVGSGTGNIASWTAPANNTGVNIVGIITVTPSLNSCTGTPMTFNVTVYPTSTVTQKTNIAVCPGATINIGSFVSVPSGATFAWANSNTAIGLVASGTGNIASWTAPANNTGINIISTITVTPSLNGCAGTPMTFTITVYPTTTVTQITNIAVCPGATINIGSFVSVPSGAIFAWTNSNTAIGLVASGTGNIASWIAPVNNTGANIVGTITVTPSLNGCTGTPMTFTVTIYPTPTVSQINNIAVCPGATINIGNFVSVPSGATITWTNSNINIGLVASGTGNILSWTAPTNGAGANIVSIITVTSTLNGCTGTPMTFTVTIYATATVTQKADIAVCSGSVISIGNFVSAPSGATFAWTNSNIAIGLAASGTGNIVSWNAPVNNTGVNIAGTITVTPSINGCAGTPMTFTVTVYPTITVTQITNITVCPGSTINIGNFVSVPSGASFTWTNSNTAIGLVSSGTGNIASWTAPVNNTGLNIAGTITVTPSLNSCTGTSMTFTVTINPSPTLFNLTGGGSYCAGGTGLSVTLSGSQTGINYQLKKNGVDEGSTVSGTGSVLVWNNLTYGTYTVVATYVASPNCSAPMNGSIVITESPAPVSYNLSGSGGYCTGGTGLTITLSGSQTGINYQLKKNGVDQGSAVNGTGSLLTWINQTYGTYTVVATYVASPNCSAPMNGSVIITVNTTPAVNQITNIAVCPGSIINIGSFVSVPSGATFAWTNSNTNIGLVASGTGNIASWTAPANNTGANIVGTIIVTPSLNGCTGATMSFTVTIYPTPTVNQKANIAVCPGSTINIGNFACSPAGATVSWHNSNTNIGLVSDGTGNIAIWTAPANNTGSNITGIISVTPTLNGCQGSQTVVLTVTIYPTPTVTQIANIDVCPGSTISIGSFVSVPSGATFTWTNSNTAIGLITSGAGNIASWTAPANNTGANIVGTITVTPTLNGCQGTPMSFTVTISPTPTVFTLTGGGSYCAGGTGLSVTLSGSQTGINYQLKKNSVDQGNAVSGTGGTLVWNSLTFGTYTVVATYGASPNCSISMTGSVVITENPAPATFTLSGGGSYCAGTNGLSVTLSGSQTSINYQLKKNGNNQGAAVSGTGSALVWSSLTAGSYTVVATFVASPYCSANMNGAVTITQNSLPVANAGVDQTIAYGTTTSISATASGGSGTFTYSWTPSSLVVSPNAQSTNTLAITAITQFIVTVHDVNTSCNNTDTMIVLLSGGPLSVLAVAQANNICQNDTAFLSALASGGTGSYSFTWSSTPSGFNATIAHPIALPSVNTTYTVSVFDGFNTQTSSTSIVVSPLPAQYTLSGNGSYCQGASGNNISLNNSNTDVLYQLYQNGQPFGSAVHGTNTVLTWTNITSGVYTVAGTFDYAPSCAVPMPGTATITQSPNPTVFNVTGTGTYCQGGTGLTVTLSGSQTGVNYQLLIGGNNSGSPVIGTGSSLTWTNQLVGNYTVMATYASSPYCSSTMSGSAIITQVIGPIFFTLTGGGSYCAGGTGLSVTLSSSQTGVNYQLKKSGTNLGGAVSGNGNALVWNNLTAGTYTVVATYVASPYCSASMTGSIVITSVALPAVSAGSDYSIPYGTSTTLHAVVTGGSGSFSYQWQPASQVVSPTLQNTNTVNLNSQTQFIVHVNDLTAPFCANTDTVVISITGSALNVTATISHDTICQGDTVYLNAVATGGSGTYTYTWSSNPTGFSSTLHNPYTTPTVSTTYTVDVNDNYNIVSTNKAVVVRPLPQSFNLSSGGYYCYGSSASITLSGSQLNTSYQLYKNGSPLGGIVGGTGNPLIWNNLLFGNYTVEASLNTPPHCSNAMQGTAVVNQYQQTNIMFNSIPHNCINNNIQPLIATPSGGTFSGNGVTGSNFSAATAGVGNHTITYTYTDGNGCIATAQQPAMVYALPVVSFSNPSDICTSAQPFMLYGGVPSGGHYSGSGIASDSLYPDSLSVGIHNVIYTYIDGNSCKNSDTATIKINGFPLAFNMSSIGYYCPGTPGTDISLSSSQIGVSYQLYKDNVIFGASVTGTGNPIVWDSILGGQYNIWGYYNSTPNCKTFMNNPLIINEAIPADLHLPADTTLCQNLSILLSVHVGYTYNWVQLPDDTLSHLNTLLVDTAVNNGLGTHTYVAWLIDNHNCISTDTINITFDNCVSVINLPNYNILIYPNPASDFTNIDFQYMRNGKYKVEFINMLGQIVFEKSITIQNNAYKLEADISKLVKSIYQVNIYYDNHIIINKKFVVN